jgi:hypothetical protein
MATSKISRLTTELRSMFSASKQTSQLTIQRNGWMADLRVHLGKSASATDKRKAEPKIKADAKKLQKYMIREINALRTDVLVISKVVWYEQGNETIGNVAVAVGRKDKFYEHDRNFMKMKLSSEVKKLGYPD